MPTPFWWITAFVVGILFFTALVDLFTALVPEGAIFVGLLGVTCAQGFGASWFAAARHLEKAIAAGMLIWAINYAWHQLFRKDALGMGDAKWTMLAVACFGVVPSIYAWGIGACLALAYILMLRIFRLKISRVTFAPFLLIGLGLGLFYLRF